MRWIRRTLRALILPMLVMTVAGCGGFSGFQLPGSDAAPPPAARPSAPPVNMAGRWLLASSGRGQCNMTFGAAQGANEGTIAPEGGCPGKFFTSRKWAYDSEGLVIRDHNSEPLAQLTSAGGARFDGKAATGDQVTLTR